MSKKAFDLVTIGRSSIDLYANDVGAAFVDIQSFAAYVGGSPTNIAVGANRLGLKTALLTGVGDDKVGDFILHFLEQEGVDTRFIPRKEGFRSSAAVLGIKPPDQFPLVFYRNACADIQLTIDDVLAAPIHDCRILEISGTALSLEPSRSACLIAAEQATEAGATVVLDIDFRADQWHDVRAFGAVVRSLLPRVDIAIGTEDEINAAMLRRADQLTIEHGQMSDPRVTGDIEANIAALLDRGPRMLVRKRGAEGARVYERGRDAVDAPGFPVEVQNILGAGDAFAAGFLYGQIQGWDGYKSARMGNACGSIVVTRHGCANFMPTEQEVFDLVERHGGF